MTKIFRYELRRLLLNKFFFGFLLVLLFYCWQVLSTETVQGVSYTAPFSPWSFGCYLARVSPLICLGELFFSDVLHLGRGAPGVGRHLRDARR